MRRKALLLIFLLTMLIAVACDVPAQDSAYLAMDPQQGWTYPVKFSLESPSGEENSLFLCVQLKYEKDCEEAYEALPVAVHMKNARNIINSDTVLVDFNSIVGKSRRIDQGYISFEKVIRTSSQIKEFKQGSRKLSVTLSPVKNADGTYAPLNSKVSALCLGFRKL